MLPSAFRIKDYLTTHVHKESPRQSQAGGWLVCSPHVSFLELRDRNNQPADAVDGVFGLLLDPRQEIFAGWYIVDEAHNRASGPDLCTKKPRVRFACA